MKKLNNSGQTLVIFVLLLPFVLLAFFYIIDQSFLFYQRQQLKTTSKIICSDASKNFDLSKIEKLVKENDGDVKNLKVSFENEYVIIQLDKKIKPVFGLFLGKKEQTISVKTKCLKQL